MKEACRILHLEDNPYDGKLVQHTLNTEGLAGELVRVETRTDYSTALSRTPFDLILSDYTLPGFDGMAALALAKEKQPDAPFIFVSGTIEEDLAVESLKRGASDYVFKNRLSRLVPAVRRALRDAQEKDDNRRAEEAMRQSENKYRQVFESLANAAFLSDWETGRVVDANRQSESLLGRTRAEIIGLNERSFHLPRTFGAYREALAAADAQKTCMEVAAEVIRKDGAIIPVNIRAGILLLYGRKLSLGLYGDMTARKLMEERLRWQATLLDMVGEAALAVNLEDRIEFWNRSAAKLYGWSSEEALARASTELLYHDLTEFNVARRMTMQNGEWRGELHQLTRDNHEILVDSRWNLAGDAEGRPKHIVLINTPAGEKPINRLEMPGKMANDLRDFAS